MPAGASFQARHIDCAVVGDAIAIATAGISGQGEAGRRWGAVIDANGAQLAIGTGVAGDIALANQDAASAIAAAGEVKGGDAASGPAAAAIGGVLPASASLQARYIDCTVIGDAIAIAAAGIAGQGQDWHCRRCGIDGDTELVGVSGESSIFNEITPRRTIVIIPIAVEAARQHFSIIFIATIVRLAAPSPIGILPIIRTIYATIPEHCARLRSCHPFPDTFAFGIACTDPGTIYVSS